MADFVDHYAKLLNEKLSLALRNNSESFKKATLEIFKSINSGGVWHLFGTGHSTMAVQEAFHRAGGLIPVNPWLEEYLMPQAGPLRNGAMEKLSGLSLIIFDYYKPQAGEVLTIISNSGINPTSVEMAEIAKSKKIKTIAITNLEHSKENKSRHPKGKKLFEVCDLVIDTGGVKGDAAITLPNLDVPVGPLSTILNSFIINSLVISVCGEFSKIGAAAPVYLSANVSGGLERNRVLEAKYLSRIPRLN
jgi:uncharacterized phosphosugar-binding protein